MKMENYLNKKVKITQIKGGSKLNARQKGSLVGLGLRGIGTFFEIKVDNSVLGMIKKVQHIIKIS
jgi:ribosomal protein L30/L7E